jgi:hypothetical protein
VKVLLGQVRTGHVVLSRDRDSLDNSAVFGTTVQMQAKKDQVYRSPTYRSCV